MNTKKIFIGLMALTLSMQSCREEYLNEPHPLSALTPDKVYSSLDNARSHIAGILRFSRNYHSGAETGQVKAMSTYAVELRAFIQVLELCCFEWFQNTCQVES